MLEGCRFVLAFVEHTPGTDELGHLVTTEAAVLSAIDYKRTFAKTYTSKDEEEEATSHCHSRSAQRVLKALLANGGSSVLASSYDTG